MRSVRVDKAVNDGVEMGRRARPQAELGRGGTRSLLLGITLELDHFFTTIKHFLMSCLAKLSFHIQGKTSPTCLARSKTLGNDFENS